MSEVEKREKQEDKLTQFKFLKQSLEKELSERGIDIHSDEYYKNEKFKMLEKEYIPVGIWVTKSWWIEKNIVGQERLKKIYGIYAMGIEHEYIKEELKNSAWMDELADKYYESKIKTKEEFARTRKDVEQYFFRKGKKESDGVGLVERLKKLGFDIDKFNHSNVKVEKVKLLYFLYCFEFENKVKICPFLGNPTLENVDNTIIGDETKNGELMACLKNNLLKEIDWDYVQQVKDSIYGIATQWEELIRRVRAIEFENKSIDYLKTINEDLKGLLSRIKDAPVLYEDSLLETFYLKLSLHEMNGRELDLLDVSDRHMSKVIEPGEYRLKKFGELPEEGKIAINWEEGKEQYETVFCYIKDHRRMLAQCVFGKETVSSNNYKKIDRTVEGIRNFLNFLKDNTSAGQMKFIPVLWVISYLQVAVFMDKKEKVENPFYRYTAEDRRTFNSEIWHGREALRKSQFAWKEKVMAQCDANSGRRQIRIWEREIEHHLDSLLLRVYQSNSLGELNNTAWEILFYIKVFLLKRDTILVRYEALQEAINEERYCLWTEDESEYHFILGILTESQFEELFDRILEDVVTAEEMNANLFSIYHFETETDDYTDARIQNRLELGIFPEERKVYIVQWEMQII